MKPKPIPSAQLVANALRSYAKRMIDNPSDYTKEEARELDRALRSCSGITDIDRVWVQWRKYAETYGWLTINELLIVKGRYRYVRTDCLT